MGGGGVAQNVLGLAKHATQVHPFVGPNPGVYQQMTIAMTKVFRAQTEAWRAPTSTPAPDPWAALRDFSKFNPSIFSGETDPM